MRSPLSHTGKVYDDTFSRLIGYMAIFLPIYPIFFLSPSFVGPDMQYTRCVRVVSVLAGVCVLLNVRRAPQFLQPRYHIYHILPLIIQKEDSSLFVIYYYRMYCLSILSTHLCTIDSIESIEDYTHPCRGSLSLQKLAQCRAVYKFIASLSVYIGYGSSNICVQPVQNTSPENTVLKDTILLYTTTTE